MNKLHPLGKLIQDAMDRNDWSLRELERRSSAAGHRMSHTNLGRIKDEPVTSIKGDVIKLLSQILNLPERAVAAAALESMGVEHTRAAHTNTLQQAVRTSQEISEYDQELLEALITVMKKRATHVHENEPESDDLRARRAGRSRQVIGSGQKNDSATIARPPLESLAAHPYFELQAERTDREFETLGEESQDPGGNDEI